MKSNVQIKIFNEDCVKNFLLNLIPLNAGLVLQGSSLHRSYGGMLTP
jgi:hypothetical protein